MVAIVLWTSCVHQNFWIPCACHSQGFSILALSSNFSHNFRWSGIDKLCPKTSSTKYVCCPCRLDDIEMVALVKVIGYMTQPTLVFCPDYEAIPRLEVLFYLLWNPWTHFQIKWENVWILGIFKPTSKLKKHMNCSIYSIYFTMNESISNEC
jgi:hypothetical protein